MQLTIPDNLILTEEEITFMIYALEKLSSESAKEAYFSEITHFENLLKMMKGARDSHLEQEGANKCKELREKVQENWAKHVRMMNKTLTKLHFLKHEILQE